MIGDLDKLARLYSTDKRTNDPNQNIYHGYTPDYERYFEYQRNDVQNMLEIGVWDGRSLKMWYEYFPNAKIWGIDNMSSVGCVTPDQLNNDRITYLLGDASNDDTIYLTLRDISFDFIIDDGSHIIDEQIRTINRFFRTVKSGGIYFIEDLEINHRRIFPGEYIKNLNGVQSTELFGELGVIHKV